MFQFYFSFQDKIQKNEKPEFLMGPNIIQLKSNLKLGTHLFCLSSNFLCNKRSDNHLELVDCMLSNLLELGGGNIFLKQGFTVPKNRNFISGTLQNPSTNN